MIKVSIADDHPMVIKGLQNMLLGHKEIKICDLYPNGRQLLDGLKKRQPDVLILDIQLPDIQGDELCHTILEKYPGICILTLTNLDQTFNLQNMMHNGALGYLLKSTDVDTLVSAIETVYKNKQFVDPIMKERMIQEMFTAKKESVSIPVLSRREQDILQLIANECTSQEIAESLYISQRTVENYRLNLLFKFDVKNVAGLVKKAMQYGLIK